MGQVVCSGCWDEADRTKIAYGTPADVSCAKRCSKSGIRQALAVTVDGSTQLYVLENPVPGSKHDGWLALVARRVELTGSAWKTGNISHLEADAVRLLPDPSKPATPPRSK